jgi:hypothetical protein
MKAAYLVARHQCCMVHGEYGFKEIDARTMYLIAHIDLDFLIYYF